jgi:hypothetical protein
MPRTTKKCRKSKPFRTEAVKNTKQVTPSTESAHSNQAMDALDRLEKKMLKNQGIAADAEPEIFSK